MKVVELVEWQTDTGRVLVRKTKEASEGKFSVVIGEATAKELEDLHQALGQLLWGRFPHLPTENMVAD